MTDMVQRTVERVTRGWQAEAAERRRISKLDPVADTLEYCAGEIAARLDAVAAAAEFETVEERARREGVTPQTVRLWIRTEQLVATEGPKGYRIAKSAQRLRRSA